MYRILTALLLIILSSAITAAGHFYEVPGPSYVPLQPAHEGAWVNSINANEIVVIGSLPDRLAVVAHAGHGDGLADWRSGTTLVEVGAHRWVVRTASPSAACNTLHVDVYRSPGWGNGFESINPLEGWTYARTIELTRADPQPRGVTKHCTICPSRDPSSQAADCIDETL